MHSEGSGDADGVVTVVCHTHGHGPDKAGMAGELRGAVRQMHLGPGAWCPADDDAVPQDHRFARAQQFEHGFFHRQAPGDG